MNSILLRVVLAAALGGLLFGFDIAVISGTTQTIKQTFALSEWGMGLTVASALWATALGALMSGSIVEHLGRRAGLRIAGWLFLISAAGCAVAWDWWSLVVFRAIGGLGVGAASVMCPMYIAEISPARLRGRLVLVFQLNIVLGILIAYLSNALITPFNLGQEEWRWKLGAECVPALAFLVALIGIPQSPRWLAKRGRLPEAREVLVRIREPDPDTRLAEIHRTVAEQPSEPLLQMKYRKPILLGLSLLFFNCMAGINAVLYYLNDTFESAGFSRADSDWGAVIVGFMNFAFTVVAMFLIDKAGRRTLLLIGAVGMAPCLAALAAILHLHQFQYLLVWILAGYIASFAISQGSVVWVYVSEIFPNRVRGRGEALSSFFGMTLGAATANLFPAMREKSAPLTFLFFAAMVVLQFFVVWRYYPETKGVTLEEMQRRLGIVDDGPRESPNSNVK